MARKTQARATEKEKLGKKIPNILGEQPLEKGVGCEGQSVEPGRLTGASGLLVDAAPGMQSTIRLHQTAEHPRQPPPG